MSRAWMFGYWGLLGLFVLSGTGCWSASYTDADGDGIMECTGPLCPEVGVDPEVTITPVPTPTPTMTPSPPPTPTPHPEICDFKDNDGDGEVDEGFEHVTLWPDQDEDGFGDMEAQGQAYCADAEAPDGTSASNDDCDDASSDIHPDADEVCNEADDDCDELVDDNDDDVQDQPTWYEDADGDGFGNPLVSTKACEQPAGYVSDGTDCDDGNLYTYPDARELCDEKDNDCDKVVDEEVVYQTWYLDGDEDGFGSDTSKTDCAKPDELGDWVLKSGDCNDGNANIHPDADEVCNKIDDNCSGVPDEGVPNITWFYDGDRDGFGATSPTISDCSQPAGYVSNSTDCDDTDPKINPDVPESEEGVADGKDQNCDGKEICYKDADNDGYRPNAVDTVASDDTDCIDANEAVGTDPTDDCDDLTASINPGATEQCNGVDDDCDETTDDGVTSSTWYKDGDGDGYGTSATTETDCKQPTGYVSNSTDCNDVDATIKPGATEVAGDSKDQNCDGVEMCYTDADDDGYRPNETSTTGSTDTDCADAKEATSTDLTTDCNDNDASIKPGANETCNGIDDDCDNQIDDGVPFFTWYKDLDGDGYGLSSITTQACSKPTEYADKDGDCNDAAATVNPGATETCNDIDDDCDNQTDEGVKTTFYQDSDNDEYGNASSTTQACSAPSGYVSNSTDCNDADLTIHPNASELCNGKDDDCDGVRDDNTTDKTWTLDKAFWFDGDGDGYRGPVCDLPVDEKEDSNVTIRGRGDCDDTNSSKYPGATGTNNCCQSPSSGSRAPYICIGSGYASLTEAAAAVSSGGQIWVFDGTYTNTSAVTLAGAVYIGALNPGKATLKGSSGSRVFTNSGGSVTVDGVNLTGGDNGISSGSGGVVVATGGTTLIQESVLSGGKVSGAGGAIYASSTSTTPPIAPTLTLRDVQLSGNSSGSGGGAIYLNTGTLTIENGWLYNNWAGKDSNESASGGAIAVQKQGTITLNQVRLSHNRADDYGGGIYLNETNSSIVSLTANNLILFDNYSARAGGALTIAGGAANLRFAAVVANGDGSAGCKVSGGSEIGSIGGIYIVDEKSSLIMKHSILWNNLSSPTITGTTDGGWNMSGTTAGWNIARCENSGTVSLSYIDSSYSSTSCSGTGLDCTYGIKVNGTAPTITGWQYVVPSFTNTDTGDFHLATSNTTLINVGNCTDADNNVIEDPDGSACDLGPYGGPDADLWDLDLDGYPDWYWPGTWSSPPTSGGNAAFDANDLDASIQTPTP